MATSRDQVIMALATDLKVWPESTISWKLDFDGWHWDVNALGHLVIYQNKDQRVINRSHWEAEIERLSSPTPSVKWKEGDICTAGTIAYVSSKHNNVMVRATHAMMELDGRSLEKKLTKERFIAQRLAVYVDDTSKTDMFEKMIVASEIDWEDE